MSIVAHSAASDKSGRGGAERQAHQDALRLTIQAEIRPVVGAAFNRALEVEVAGFVGRPKGRHRAKLHTEACALSCLGCGCHQTLDFVRKGHYQRTELTLWGAVDVRIPRVECVCGRCPLLPFKTVIPYDRLWSDVDAFTLALVACDVSLRSTAQLVRLPSGTTVSLGTAQRRVKRVAAHADWELAQKLTVSPAVVLLDAIWGKMLVDSGQKKRDKRGRLRCVKQVMKAPLLVAQSVDPSSGATTLLAWVGGTAESVADWTRLLTKLYERGVQAATGLRLLIHDGNGALEAALEMVDFGDVRRQRCIFHKLQNVLRAVAGEAGMSKEAKQERIQAVVAEARAIYDAPTEAEAWQRAGAFHAHWSTAEPKAVATLEREFAATVTYYAVCAEAAAQGQSWTIAHVRTTSPLEGLNRCLRAKWHQAGAFHSAEGRTGAFWLVVKYRQRCDRSDRIGWLPAITAALPKPDQVPTNFPKP